MNKPADHPDRFSFVPRLLKRPINGRKVTKKRYLTRIKHGEPGYEEVMLEMATITHTLSENSGIRVASL
jgi:hypothetical protein